MNSKQLQSPQLEEASLPSEVIVIGFILPCSHVPFSLTIISWNYFPDNLPASSLHPRIYFRELKLRSMGENGMLGEGNPDLKDQEAEKEVLAQCTVHTDSGEAPGDWNRKQVRQLENRAREMQNGYRRGWKWR